MTRSIVLRFDAVCYDCGASLSAGTTARWFGKGRVSCCGPEGASAPSVSSIDPRPSYPAPRAYGPNDETSLPPGLRNGPTANYRAVGQVKPGQLSPASIPAEALASGLSKEQVVLLSTQQPNMMLLVRLQSGARFCVPAQHAAHVIRAIEESLLDRVRDVSRMVTL